MPSEDGTTVCEKCIEFEAEIKRMKMAFRSMMWTIQHKQRKIKIHKNQRDEAYEKIKQLEYDIAIKEN